METQFTKKVRSWLKEHGGGSLKLGASMFLEKGTPDLICCYKGKAFFLENKVYPNKPSPIQLGQINKLKGYGFFVWILTEHNGFVLDDKLFTSLDAVFEHIYKETNGS